jgi:hypothetical protein
MFSRYLVLLAHFWVSLCNISMFSRHLGTKCIIIRPEHPPFLFFNELYLVLIAPGYGEFGTARDMLSSG